MARIVANSAVLKMYSNKIIKFSDGSISEEPLDIDDMVEDLRYVSKNTINTVSGRISNITYNCSKITTVNINKPVDHFSKDVLVKTITIDNSIEYHSEVYSVPAKEIIEDEGITDVVKVDVISHPIVNVTMEYSDGTTNEQELEVGDVLGNMVIMAGKGKPDITGAFRIAAFMYSTSNKSGIPNINGLYLTPVSGGKNIKATFTSIISFNEVSHVALSNPTSLGGVAAALNSSATGEVYAQLDTNVTIPPRDDGKITTVMINEGKILHFDLNGHNITTQAYAFYVNGGELNLFDSTGSGAIEGTLSGGLSYPMIYVAGGGTCNMYGGTIDTTKAEHTEESPNWLYGVVCASNGIFNMTGGKMIICGASGISITNGTASGEGAQFIIGGNSVIESIDCAAIYLADNKSVIIKDKAIINGGIVARMGDITIQGEAVVNGHPANSTPYPLGAQVCKSGVEKPKAAILALTGVYQSETGNNDMNIVVKDSARVNSYIDDAIDIAMIDTKYDQIVNVTVEKSKYVKFKDLLWRAYTHDELAELATAEGKTLGAKQKDTTLTVTVNGSVEYPQA